MPHGGLATTLVASLRDVMASMAAVDASTLTDDDVHAALPDLLAAVDQLCGLTSTMVGSFDTRGLSDVDACRTTRTWLQSFGRMSQGAAGGWVRRARLMADLPAVAAAARAGQVSAEQLKVIDDLAHAVGIDKVQPADRVLADLCPNAGKDEVAKACERIYAHVNPDGAHPDPQDLHDKRELVLSRSGHMTYLRGRLDPEGAAALHTALDALMRPPASDETSTTPQRRCDALVELARITLAAGQLPEVGGTRPQIGLLITPTMLLAGSGDPTRDPAAHAPAAPDPAAPDPAAPDPAAPDPAAPDPAAPDRAGTERSGRDRSGPDRSGADGRSCCEVGWRDHPPGGPPLAPDALEQIGIPHRPDLPWMHWVDEVPAAVAQRIACDAQTWRALLDPATGQVLELGRAHRLVPYWLRKALIARDHGCRWPGCTAPAAWTDAHHIIPWWVGGRTDIDNLLLLCRYHHVKVHEGRWRLRYDSATGEVTVTRPDGLPYQLGVSRSCVSPGRHAPPAARR